MSNAHKTRHHDTPVTDLELEFEDEMRGGNDNIIQTLNTALQLRNSVASNYTGGAWNHEEDYRMDGGAAKAAKAKGKSGRGASPGFKIFGEVQKFLRSTGKYTDFKVADYSSITKLIRDDVLKEMKAEKVDDVIFDKILARAKAQHAEYVRKYRQQQKGGADFIRYLF